MGKQSSNKKYSFKGQRTISERKSKNSKSKLSSESEGSTTEDYGLIRSIFKEKILVNWTPLTLNIISIIYLIRMYF